IRDRTVTGVQTCALPICSYGGRFFGRAFDPSQLIGDRCWAVLGELRYDIPTTIKQLTRAQLYAYADHGQIDNIDPARGTPRSQQIGRASCRERGEGREGA